MLVLLGSRHCPESSSYPEQFSFLHPGWMRAVLYCCMVACRRFGGNICLMRSIRVSGVVTSLDSTFLSDCKRLFHE